MFRSCLILLFVLQGKLFFAQTFTAEQVRSDLDFLQKALYNGHPGIYTYNTRDSLDLFFQQLRSQIPPGEVTIDHVQLMVRLAIARVRDGHTSVMTPFSDDSTEVMPLLVRALGDRVYVLRNYSGDTTLHRGAELLEINGIPASDVLHVGRLLPSADGYHLSHRNQVTSLYFTRYFRLLFGETKVFVVKALQPSGQRTEHRLMPKSRAALLQLQQVKTALPREKPVYRLRDQALYRDTLHADMAVLKMTDFEAFGFRRFYRKMFRYLEREKIDKLVLDFRWNTGGNVLNMSMLTGQILDKPITYHYERRKGARPWPYFGFKDKIYIASAWLGFNTSLRLRHSKREGQRISIRRIKSRKRHHFDGQVFVLTDGFSFSAASMCASFLKHHGQVTIIGTETGGAESVNCGGGFPTLRLPETRLRIRFPIMFLDYNLGLPISGRGVQPDYPTPYTIRDVLEGRDLEMEKVYELLKKS